MISIRKWRFLNHPLNSKHTSIRISWFVFIVSLATILSIIASLGAAAITFYEEMEEWCYTVNNSYHKLFDKDENQ